MVDYHYDSNIFKRLARRRRRLWFAGAATAIILIIIGLVIYDGLTAPNHIISEPIATEVTLGEAVERQVFEKPTYVLTTDTSWQEIEIRNNLLKATRYQSVVDGLVLRELTVYVDRFPKELPATYVLPVEVRDDEIIPLATSPKCDELQNKKSNKRDVVVSWAGVEFLCDPDLQAFVVIASHNEMGTSMNIAGAQSDATYMFEYRDFSSVPQPSEFQELLRDFKAQ